MSITVIGGRRKSFTPEGTFLPYQQKVLKDEARTIVWEKSRQIGATYTAAYWAVRRRLLRLNPANPKCWFTSSDDSNALEFMDYCVFWARQLQERAVLIPEYVYDKETDLTSRSLLFACGGEINGLTSASRQLRGKRGDAIWDEAAFNDHPVQMYRAIDALKMWGGARLILSSHNGLGSIFNTRLVADSKVKRGWSHHRTTIVDAVNQGMLYKLDGNKTPSQKRIREFLDELRTDCLDEDQWRQEYMCDPVDEAVAFLTYVLIDGMEREGILVKDLLSCKGPLYLGMDIGRHKNPSVISVLEELSNLLFLRKIIVMEKWTFQKQRNALWPILRLAKLRRAGIDATGMGEEIGEDAARDFPGKVEAIKFTSQVKDSLAHGLYREAEDKTLFIPKGDFALREDLHSVRKTVTSTGHTRFDVTAGRKNDNADRFWSLALARNAARDPEAREGDVASAGIHDEVLAGAFGKRLTHGYDELGGGGKWNGAF